MASYKTNNTYKGAYFMVMGAILVDISVRHLKKKKIMTSYAWELELENVPVRAILNWDNGKAIVNVTDLQRERNRIKKLAKSKRL